MKAVLSVAIAQLLVGTTLYSRPQMVPLDLLIPKHVREALDARKREKKLRLGVETSPGFPPSSSVNLSYRDTSIKEQFGGTCTAFGLTAIMENLLDGRIDLSERHAWSRYKVFYADVALRALALNGVVEERYWPQRNTNPYIGYSKNSQYKVLSYSYISDDVPKALDSLYNGFPVYLSLSLPTDMYNCAGTIRPNSAIEEGGHAVALVGYRLDPKVQGGGYFLVKNSWGRACGNNGYQWLPFHICERNDGKAYCVMWSVRAAGI